MAPRERENQKTKQLGETNTRGVSRRQFLTGPVKGFAVATALAGAGYGVSKLVDFFKPVDPETGIRATIVVPCSDSRMTTLLKVNGRPEAPGNYLHFANAGAHPDEDLKHLVEHLVSNGLKRKEILVINAAHFGPACGGSRVNPETVEKISHELKKQLGFDEEQLQQYLNQYGHTPKSILKSVAYHHNGRAQIHGNKLSELGVHYISGVHHLKAQEFRPR